LCSWRRKNVEKELIWESQCSRHVHPWGLVLLKETSNGKFHTTCCLSSWLFWAICDMPSSIPCFVAKHTGKIRKKLYRNIPTPKCTVHLRWQFPNRVRRRKRTCSTCCHSLESELSQFDQQPTPETHRQPYSRYPTFSSIPFNLICDSLTTIQDKKTKYYVRSYENSNREKGIKTLFIYYYSYRKEINYNIIGMVLQGMKDSIIILQLLRREQPSRQSYTRIIIYHGYQYSHFGGVTNRTTRSSAKLVFLPTPSEQRWLHKHHVIH